VWTNNKVTNKRGDNTLLARPGQYLQDHLQWTAKRTQEIWDMVYLPRLYFATIDKQILRGISTQIALVHDLGKVTRYFQDRVINIESENYYHTQLSSVVVFYEVLEYLADYPEDVRYTLSYIASIIVKKHHLGLINLEGDWQLTREEIVMIQKQVQDIDVIELDYLVSKLDGLYMPFTLDQLREWCNTIQTDLVKGVKALNNKSYLDPTTIDYWDTKFIPKLLFSVLVESDIRAAHKTDKNLQRTDDILITDMFLLDILYKRDELRMQRGYIPRIIYLQPALNTVKHGTMVIDDGRAKHWNSEIILTTPDTFTSVLFPQSRLEYRKFWTIPGSIVVTNHLSTVDWLEEYLTEKFGCVFVQ